MQREILTFCMLSNTDHREAGIRFSTFKTPQQHHRFMLIDMYLGMLAAQQGCNSSR